MGGRVRRGGAVLAQVRAGHARQSRGGLSANWPPNLCTQPWASFRQSQSLPTGVVSLVRIILASPVVRNCSLLQPLKLTGSSACCLPFVCCVGTELSEFTGLRCAYLF